MLMDPLREFRAFIHSVQQARGETRSTHVDAQQLVKLSQQVETTIKPRLEEFLRNHPQLKPEEQKVLRELEHSLQIVRMYKDRDRAYTQMAKGVMDRLGEVLRPTRHNIAPLQDSGDRAKWLHMKAEDFGLHKPVGGGSLLFEDEISDLLSKGIGIKDERALNWLRKQTKILLNIYDSIKARKPDLQVDRSVVQEIAKQAAGKEFSCTPKDLSTLWYLARFANADERKTLHALFRQTLLYTFRTS